MKRFWIGVGLLAAFLLMGILVGSRMRAIHIPISEKLAQAANTSLSGNWEEALLLEEEASGSWDRYRNFSAAFCNHQPMDEIDARLRHLEVYRQRRQIDLYCAECLYIAERLEDLAESFRLSWWNLL